MKQHTRRLTEVAPIPQSAPEEGPTPVVDFRRPWRIALIVKSMQVKIVVDLIKTLSIGRLETDADTGPDIDLQPFFADQFGVSRRHLVLAPREASVVVIDTHSTNGTMLNGRWLIPDEPYPIRHGDQLMLGGFEVQVEFLINPLE